MYSINIAKLIKEERMRIHNKTKKSTQPVIVLYAKLKTIELEIYIKYNPIMLRKNILNNLRLPQNVRKMRAISSTAKGEVIDSKDIQMPTPLSAGFNMKFQRANEKDNQKRPLVVIAGWMGAKERQLNPYISFYHSKNIDTLSFAVGPKHVLFPYDSKKQMEVVIDFISNPSDPRITAPSCILFHHFSVGGFLYGLLLLLLKEDKRFDSFTPMIRAQIFDSPPDYKSIASGMLDHTDYLQYINLLRLS